MRNTSILAAMTAIALSAGAALGTAQAQPGPGGPGGPGGGHHDPLFAGVTLTDSQKSQLQALHKASWQSNKALFEQMHAIDDKIDTTLLGSGTVTEATLAPLVQQKAALMEQLDTARLTQQIAERNLLTEAQLATASSVHAQLVALNAQERALHAAPNDVPPADVPPAN